MMSTTVTFTSIPPLPIQEINAVDAELCLLPEKQRNRLLAYLAKNPADQKINKKALRKLRLPYTFTVLIHNNEIYVRHALAGAGSFGVVKLLWNVRTHEWRAMKITSEHSDGCGNITYLHKVSTLKTEYSMLRECKIAEHGLGSRVSPKKGEQLYIVIPVQYGMELFVYHTEVLQRAISHPHHSLSRYTQICMLVHQLHAKGILHRDIKTENLMLDMAKNQISLVDFGNAIYLPEGKDAFVESNARGTIYNLAPELLHQHQSYSYSVLTDRFSTGVTIGESARFTTHDIEQPAKLVPRHHYTPLDLKIFTICKSLMHPNPAKRIPLDQAAEELHALHALIESPLLVGLVNLNELLQLSKIKRQTHIKLLSESCHEIAMLTPKDFKLTPNVYSIMHEMHRARLRVFDKLFHTDNPVEILVYLREQEPHIKRELSPLFSLVKPVVMTVDKPEPPVEKPQPALAGAQFRHFQPASTALGKAEKFRLRWFKKQ